MAGRPGLYTPELAEVICERIATSSMSMKSICEELDLSVATVLTWLSEGHRNYIEEFAKMYARAKQMQADYLAEEILDISDDGSNDFMTITKGQESYEIENKEWTSRSKLRVDARKWLASKLAPRKYGDKLDLTSDGDKIPAVIPNVIVYNSAPPLAGKEEDVK